MHFVIVREQIENIAMHIHPSHNVFIKTFQRIHCIPKIGYIVDEEEAVIDFFITNPRTRILHLSEVLSVSQSFLWRTMH